MADVSLATLVAIVLYQDDKGINVHAAYPRDGQPDRRLRDRAELDGAELLNPEGGTMRGSGRERCGGTQSPKQKPRAAVNHYRRDGADRQRVMTLGTDEFNRRILLHVLPKGVHRIRHCGLLASAGRKANVARARELLCPRDAAIPASPA
jgi:hypothetical protein